MCRVYILIVNWNGWGDTIECLESVFRLSYDNFKVVVCDNGSLDGSIEKIKYWADGKLNSWVPSDNLLRRLSYPPISKPINYIEYEQSAAENGVAEHNDTARLVLVHTGGNLGFAGGNNVGIRYSIKRDDFDYVWLLNNDTVVQAESLRALVETLGKNPQAGLCGSTLLYYDRPDLIQAQGGGALVRWKGVSSHIASGLLLAAALPREEVLTRLSYVVGASMLVSKEFLRDVGLMNEEYFLYMEELDWAERAKGKFQLEYAPKSLVYHKEGAAIGTDSRGIGSSLSQRYLFRNRLLFYRKYYRKLLPPVMLYLILQSLMALIKGRFERFGIIWGALLSSPESEKSQ